MKYPKHQANLFVVLREGITNTVVGAFADAELADDFKDACTQEWIDKGASPVPKFKVVLTTFYAR